MIFGATTPTLAITGLTVDMSGYLYRCRATNEYGAAFSDSAELTVNASSNYMLLPPLTESSGATYANEAEAQDFIDYYTADCLVYSQIPNAGGGGPRISLSAVYYSGELDIECDSGNEGNEVICSVNLEAGSYLTIDYSLIASGGAATNGGVIIYDENGNSIGSAPISGVGSVVLGAAVAGPPPSWPPWGGMPYTGKYIFLINGGASGSGETVDFNVKLSSSGALTPNPIRALYECGNPEPCNLDCTP